jgi:methylase of polypeptide subunit release factors
MLPIRDATPREFAAFHALLREAGYTEADICARSGAPTVADAFEAKPVVPPPAIPRTIGDVLYRTFFQEGLVAESDARRLLGEDRLDLTFRLGVLRRVDDDEAMLAPTVLLYPIEDVFLASDLTRDPAAPEAPFELAADAVYPAITTNTREFLALLPRTPCARFLELCAGAGAAALLMAPHCDEAVATDIAERSMRFADWNARLNGRHNVRAVQSDVYGALDGARFDRIAAHPPYMPSLERSFVYRDGGEDGEQITRQVVAGLADHLAPGGDFRAFCLLTDREGAPVEERVRAMLGPGGDAFDVVIVTTAAADVTEYYFRRTISWQTGREDAQRIAQGMRAAGVQDIVLCAVTITRQDGGRPPITIRRRRGAGMTAADIDRLLARESGMDPVPEGAALLAARPRLARAARLRVSHVPHDGGWAAEQCVLTLETPFPRTLQTQPSIAALLDACAGKHTAHELFVSYRDAGKLPDDVTEDMFAAVLAQLVRDGFLELVPDGDAAEGE